jgi:hypothetical protein
MFAVFKVKINNLGRITNTSKQIAFYLISVKTSIILVKLVLGSP